MAILKYFNKGNWLVPYGNLMKDLLKRSNNLSDVDFAKATEVLELSGENNTTHFHDSRYLPLIEEIKTKAGGEASKIIALINKEKTERVAADDALRDKLNSTETELNKRLKKIGDDVNTKINAKMAEINTTLNNVDVLVNNAVAGFNVGNLKVNINTDWKQQDGLPAWGSHVPQNGAFIKISSLGSGTNGKPKKVPRCSFGKADYRAERVIDNGKYSIQNLLNLLTKFTHKHNHRNYFKEMVYSCKMNPNYHEGNPGPHSG